MLFDARLRPVYSPARVNRAGYEWANRYTSGLYGAVSYIMNTPTDDVNNRIKGSFLTWFKSYSIQTIYVTAVNVLSNKNKE